ncbi:MAG: enoyl-CoA hydratase [Actinobacteria bacterium]|nr:enoyl-CoA hydratase [Actinomycetota bacterium]
MEATRLRDRLIYESADGIATLTLDNGAQANLQDHDMVWAFDEALDLAEADYDVKVVVIKANGKGFCAGHLGSGDYPEFIENFERSGTTWTGQSTLFLDPVLRLWEFPKPTIAAVHGYAAGCGTYWALLPDITIASDDAWFQMPHVKLMGLPGAETMIEPWVFMNWKLTYEYLYRRQRLTAQQALEFHLVNHVVARDDLESTTYEIAAEIAEAPLTTLRATKLLVKRAWELMGLRVHLQWSNDMVTLTAHHTDVREVIHKNMQDLVDQGRDPGKGGWVSE